ncbi:hypothetical protein ACFP81_02075 [Deinococcus lacus]|uniref:Uncharacterized protein n=1 Tax=Deinococcus lacus TaxID=392561 RepID=A0ABW1YBT1_9DEIO
MPDILDMPWLTAPTWLRRRYAWEMWLECSQELRHRLAVLGTQKILSHAAHTGLSGVTRPYRRLWRRRGHQQERLHLLGLHEEAQELDPRPRKLGVMRDIW